MRYIITLCLSSALCTAPALAQTPRVVTDIAPVQALVATVMGDLGLPGVLLDRGADPHDFQLRPSQAATLTNAELVVWTGPQMTPWLDRALTGLEVKAAQIELMALDGTFKQPLGAKGGPTDHGDHTEPAAEAAIPDDHDHGDIDPHVWLDPQNAVFWLGEIAAELARLDPQNAATYAANAARGQADIAALDAELRALLLPVRDRPFVVFHDAYGYFTTHFGLTVAGAVRLGDATSPGAARLTELRDALQANAALCVFPETNHDPKILHQLVDGTPVKLGGALDPSGAALAPGAGLYPALLRGMATTIVACLGGK